LSILKSSCHELRIAYGLTLMTPSPRRWEAFPTPGALTHTRITWAFSPSAPQVPGVTPGSPLCPWCFGHPLWRGARHLKSSLVIGQKAQIGPNPFTPRGLANSLCKRLGILTCDWPEGSNQPQSTTIKPWLNVSAQLTIRVYLTKVARPHSQGGFCD
jgi:hypothetical protein